MANQLCNSSVFFPCLNSWTSRRRLSRPWSSPPPQFWAGLVEQQQKLAVAVGQKRKEEWGKSELIRTTVQQLNQQLNQLALHSNSNSDSLVMGPARR
jgi:hypothetical protein